jgi:hypothetical protein
MKYRSITSREVQQACTISKCNSYE